MQEQIPPQFREANRPPFALPDDFDDVRLHYHTEAAGVEPARLPCNRKRDQQYERAPLADLRLRWKLVAADGEALREGECLVRGALTDDAAREEIGGFLAWYMAVREIAEQNDARFHPASEIPITLPGDDEGGVKPTPPHFFTS